MSKKKKSKKSNPEKKTLKQKNLIIIVSVLLIISFVVIALQLKSTSNKTSDSVSAIDDNSLRRGEIRSTLSSTQFSDPFIAETYQIAKDIPHVLDSVKCYCLCDRPPFNHKSLLSCYVDAHAAG